MPHGRVSTQKPPFWIINRQWKQLYMSSYHLAPDYLKCYVDELRKFGADYIEGIPSSVYAIARYIRDKRLPVDVLNDTIQTVQKYWTYDMYNKYAWLRCKK